MAFNDGSSQPKVKIKGLYTDPNPIGSVPDGSLLVADNVVIDRDDTLETKRGTKPYITSMSSGAKQLMQYKNRILVHFGTTLGYDSSGTGTKTDYSGSYTAPGTNRMRSQAAQQNFYFCTTEGVKKLDSLTGTPTRSGGLNALDGSAATTGASGFMANNTQRAYRILWGIKDANNNLILGTPSQRILVANSSGGTRDVSLTFTFPDGVTTSHFYQIYRSQASASSTAEGNDELQLAIEKNPTSAEISAEEATITDNVPDSLLGATLYTSPSQQGIANANDVPPLCMDMVNFKEHALYVNTETKQRLLLNFISVDTPQFDYFDYTGNTNSNTTITGLSSTTGLATGQLITGTGIPANTTVVSVDSATQVTISQAATATAVGVSLRFRDRITLDGENYYANDTEDVANKYFIVSGASSPATNIATSARSLVKIINKASSNIYAFYISNFDDLPGKLLIEDRIFGGTAWAATSSKGSSFSPVLQNTGTTVQSSNERGKNRIYISKPQQPEAVPTLQWIPAGSADAEIKRIIALRDACFIFKEDGVFRFYGTDVTNFQVIPFDTTAIIKGADTATELNNEAWCYSTQGVISVSDNGVRVRSKPIERTLLEQSSDSFTSFNSIAFAFGYESERRYTLFVPTTVNDTYATQAWVYNTFTQSWTRWVENRTCGIVLSADNRIYVGQGDVNNVRRERKDYLLTDYAEDSFAVTISSYNGNVVTLNSVSNAVVGQTLAQLGGTSEVVRQAVVTAVGVSTVTVDRQVLWNIAAAELYNPININVKWAPLHSGAPGILKQFPEISLFFREANFAEIDVSFSSNFSDLSSATSISPLVTGAFGEGVFGGIPWGGGAPDLQPIRTFIPREQQRAHWIDMSIEHNEACTNFALCGFSYIAYPMSERFK